MSLNEISQENTNLPSTGIINGSFKSLNVNGVPIGAGGSGDLQSAYDNGNIIQLENSATKPFIVQQTGGGNDLLSVNNDGIQMKEDVEIIGFSNSLKLERETASFKIASEDGDSNAQQLTVKASDLILDAKTTITTGSGLLELEPSTIGTALQSLVSNGLGGVEFESLRTYNITWAGTGVVGPRWLIPNGNKTTASGTAGSFATTFYCPYNMTANIGAFTRTFSGGVTTTVSFFNTTSPGTSIYTYDFSTAGAEIVIPALTLVAGETYNCIATSSGTSDVNMDITFIID